MEGDQGQSPDIPILLVDFEETPAHYANDVYVGADPMGIQLVFTQLLAR